MAVIEIDDVLVARIASLATISSSEANRACLAARSSTIASTTSAASTKLLTSCATDNLCAAACAASGVSFPLSASLFSWVRNPSTANAAEPSRTSSNCTRCPATAAICAIPLPIAPAPITATVQVVGSGAALMPLHVVAALHDHEAVRHKRCISVRRIRCRVTTGAMEIREGGRLVNEHTTR